MDVRQIQWENLPLVLGPQDLLRLRGTLLPKKLSKATVYAMFHRRDFPSVRVGKRFLVGREAFRRWLEERGQAV